MTSGTRALLTACLSVSIALACLTPFTCMAADEIPPTYIQVFIGAAQFNEDRMTFQKTADDDPGTVTTNDLSTMPYLGIGGQYGFSEAETHIGLDATLLFGWRSHNSSVTAGNGQAHVYLDTELWMLDLAMGLYAQSILGDHWRLYAAAGPVMLFAGYTEDGKQEDLEASPTETSKDSNTDSEFGIGGYARVGAEYRLQNGAFMGVCMRGVKTNLEFNTTIDDGGLDGVQGFLTYSQPF
jgi:hypothetical protein